MSAGLDRRGALAGGAAALAVALWTPARAAPVDRLEHLLVLEQGLETAYRTALARDVIEPALGEALLAHEREHVRALEQTLRGRDRSPRAGAPPAGSGTAFAGPAAFARHALELEGEAIAAYQDVLATLPNERLLQPLGSIMAAAAQHLVALREVAGDELLALSDD